MMRTLIGADQLVLTLSGRIEISSDAGFVSGVNQTVIESYPGDGIPAQRHVLNGLRVLDVETLSPAPRPRVIVERIA